MGGLVDLVSPMVLPEVNLVDLEVVVVANNMEHQAKDKTVDFNSSSNEEDLHPNTELQVEIRDKDKIKVDSVEELVNPMDHHQTKAETLNTEPQMVVTKIKVDSEEAALVNLMAHQQPKVETKTKPTVPQAKVEIKVEILNMEHPAEGKDKVHSTEHQPEETKDTVETTTTEEEDTVVKNNQCHTTLPMQSKITTETITTDKKLATAALLMDNTKFFCPMVELRPSDTLQIGKTVSMLK